MAMKIMTASDLNTGGSFFKPAEYVTAKALLFEPKRLNEGVTDKYKGVIDTITTDLTVFTTTSLANGDAELVLRNVVVNQGPLVGRLQGAIGSAMVAAVRKATSKAGNEYWTFQDADEESFKSVVEYIETRDQVIDAIAADPPF